MHPPGRRRVAGYVTAMRRGELWGFGTGLLVVTVLGLVDAFTSVALLGALLLGVVLAALTARPWSVAAVGIYALGWAAVLGYDGEHWTATHWLRLGVVAAGTAFAVIGSWLRQRQTAALIRMANVAEVAQRALLRPLEERYDGVDMAVRYLSSADGALVGGDVYDVEVSRWGLRVLIADVCGHGLEAVEKASTITFAFREAAHTCDTLGQVVSVMENSFRRVTNRGDYATALLLEINGDTVKIANCGHPEPLVVDRDRSRWLAPDRRAVPIGLGTSPSLQRLLLAPGERLLVYTDGLTEARNPAGGFLDLEQRALACLSAGSLEQALDDLIAQLQDHAGGSLRDDVIAFAVQLTPTP
jgi:phosphoserine phosphatase RsbU/P